MGTMAEESDGVRSIRRALDILSLLTNDTPSISVRDIVAATGLPKTTVLRLVQTLEHSPSFVKLHQLVPTGRPSRNSSARLAIYRI